jgi:PAS domain S-box-containing protein
VRDSDGGGRLTSAAPSDHLSGMPALQAPVRRGLTLRWRLVLLVVAGIVPLVAFSFAHQYLEYRDKVATTGRQTLELARSMSLLVERELQSCVATLQALSVSRALQEGDFDAFRTAAETIVAQQFPGANILLLREDGQQIMNTILPRGATLPVRSNLDSIRQVFTTGAPVVSNLYQGAVGPRPVVAIDVPIKGPDGVVTYILSMNPRLGVFADVIHGQQPSPSWVVGVFDRRGVTIARVPDAGRFVGQEATSELASHLRVEREGVIESTSREGFELLTVFSRGERFGWAVAIGVPRAELTGPALSAALSTLAVGGGVLGVSLALALYAAHGIAGPIGSLRRLAAAPNRDAFFAPEPTGLREADEVAEALRTAEDARRRSREAEIILRDGIETIPEGFSIYDEEDRLVMCNESYRRQFPDGADLIAPGIRYDEILRAGLAQGHYADARGCEEAWFEKRLQGHRNPRGAFEQQLADGRWVLVTKHRLSNHWTAGVSVDITERKMVEQALSKSEERFRLVVESVANAIVMVGPVGRIEMVNIQAERIFGYSRTELLGRPVEILLPERYRLHHPGLRQAFFADPQARPMGAGRELYARRKDGSEFAVEIGLSPIETDDGKMVLAAIVDITERKHAEQNLFDAQHRTKETLAALRKSEELLKHAQHLAHMGSDIRNLRTGETEWSDETFRIFGVSRETYIPSAESFLQLVHPDDRALVLATREQIGRGICPEPFEYRVVRPDGVIRQIHRENELIRDAAGDLLYLTGTIHDVTERRRTEAQLRQAQKMEAIGNLTGGMAHDFNNLLGILVGNLDLVRARLEGDAELDEIVGEALEAAWRGADLTGRLLAFARRQPLRPAQIDLTTLINDTVRLLRRLLGADIEISLNLAADSWPVIADPAQLEASLANLATNARDAMPKGGRLIITTTNRHLDADYVASHADATEGDFAMIEVSDTGVGMSSEVLSQIFEPFFTTKEPGKGTGLGLSMVFGFLRQSGGHVNVYSEVGVGTTFRLYLPRAKEVSPPREVTDTAPVARGAGETVLVVEDNPAMRRIVLRQLRGLGYRALECDRAAAALDLLQRETVDLLFTDIVMPGGLDGVELARLALERWPAVKVVLTSGFPEARIDGDGVLLGGLRLLSKPYGRDELAAVLRAALDA